MTNPASAAPEIQALAEALNQAVADHRAGRTDDARARYRRILALEPCVPDALHLLGLLADPRSEEAPQLVRRAISLEPGAALYWLNLGNRYVEADEAEEAAICFEHVLRIAPDHEVAARNLGFARIQLATSSHALARTRRRWGTAEASSWHPDDMHRRSVAGPGHLLIRGWGCGFWGEVNHVAVQLALADILGREPTVYWGTEFRYRPPGIENAWDAYFEPVSATEIADIERSAPTCFPGQWHLENLRTSKMLPLRISAQNNPLGTTALAGLNRPEALVVADGYNELGDVLAWAAPAHPLARLSVETVFRQVFTERIRLRPDLRRRIDELAQRHFRGRPMLAIHYRAQQGDKQAESLEGRSLAMDDYFRPIDHFLADHPEGQAFLLTDMAPVAQQFQARYRERLTTLPRQRLDDASELDLGLNQARDGHRLALEVIEDAYLAAKCDYFLGDGASGVSCCIAVLKPWPRDRIQLLRRNVFQERRGRSLSA